MRHEEKPQIEEECRLLSRREALCRLVQAASPASMCNRGRHTKPESGRRLETDTNARLNWAVLLSRFATSKACERRK
jgi:hypothetical protein